MVAAEMVPEDMALGGDWYEGETGSIFSEPRGACKPIDVFRVGRECPLGVCMGAETE
jgi:hypothetical protein